MKQYVVIKAASIDEALDAMLDYKGDKTDWDIQVILHPEFSPVVTMWCDPRGREDWLKELKYKSYVLKPEYA